MSHEGFLLQGAIGSNNLLKRKKYLQKKFTASGAAHVDV